MKLMNVLTFEGMNVFTFFSSRIKIKQYCKSMFLILNMVKTTQNVKFVNFQTVKPEVHSNFGKKGPPSVLTRISPR